MLLLMEHLGCLGGGALRMSRKATEFVMVYHAQAYLTYMHHTKHCLPAVFGLALLFCCMGCVAGMHSVALLGQSISVACTLVVIVERLYIVVI